MKIFNSMIRYGVIASLAMAPAAVLADSPNYNFIEGAYVNIDLDGIDDGDGFGIGGSAEVGENIFIFADYSTVSFSGGLDFSITNVGVGYKSPVSDTTDVNVSIGYIKADLDAGVLGSADEDGYSLDASLRSMLSNEFELNGGVTYIDLGGGGGDDTQLHVGGVYSFNDTFAVMGDVLFSDDITTYWIGGRFYFK